MALITSLYKKYISYVPFTNEILLINYAASGLVHVLCRCPYLKSLYCAPTN